MVLIVGAMKEELGTIIEELKLNPVPNAVFNEFMSVDQKILVCVTGIGTVNAAAGLTSLLVKYENIDYVLVLGTTGAVSSELKPLDLVLVENAIYAQVDVRTFGYQLGQVPQMPLNYGANKNLASQILVYLSQKNPLKLVNGATLDVFVDSKLQVENLIDPLPINTKIVDMEIASYYHTAYLFDVPIVGLKIVSDVVDHDLSSNLEFAQFLPIASTKLKDILLDVLKIELRELI